MTWCRYLICLVPYRWAVWLWLLKRSALVVYTTRLPEKRTGYCRLPQCCLSSNEYSTLRHAHICGFWGSWTQVSFEYYPMINGTWLDSSLGEFFNDLLQHVLLPYVRTAYNCKSCAVGDILIRRSGMEGWPKQMLHIWSCQLTGWWFGTMEFYDFPKYRGIITPTDFHIFQRGWNHQPLKVRECKMNIWGMCMYVRYVPFWDKDVSSSRTWNPRCPVAFVRPQVFGWRTTNSPTSLW